MEGSTAVVGLDTLAEERHVLELVADEGSGDLDLLAADHNDLLSLEELLGNDGGKTTEKVSLAIDDDSLIEREREKKEEYD